MADGDLYGMSSDHVSCGSEEILGEIASAVQAMIDAAMEIQSALAGVMITHVDFVLPMEEATEEPIDKKEPTAQRHDTVNNTMVGPISIYNIPERSKEVSRSTEIKDLVRESLIAFESQTGMLASYYACSEYHKDRYDVSSGIMEAYETESTAASMINNTIMSGSSTHERSDRIASPVPAAVPYSSVSSGITRSSASASIEVIESLERSALVIGEMESMMERSAFSPGQISNVVYPAPDTSIYVTPQNGVVDERAGVTGGTVKFDSRYDIQQSVQGQSSQGTEAGSPRTVELAALLPSKVKEDSRAYVERLNEALTMVESSKTARTEEQKYTTSMPVIALASYLTAAANTSSSSGIANDYLSYASEVSNAISGAIGISQMTSAIHGDSVSNMYSSVRHGDIMASILPGIHATETLRTASSSTINNVSLLQGPMTAGGMPSLSVPVRLESILQSAGQTVSKESPQAAGDTVNFNNTFNITVSIKDPGSETEMRELGRKIGLALSEELKRYGGMR